MVTRWVASPLPTSAPSVTSARPMRPEIGAGGTAFSRSSLALPGRFSLLDARLGGIEFLLADGLDFEQRRIAGKHRLGRRQVGFGRCGLGLVGAGVDLNSGVPAAMSVPSVNRRFSTTPSTRALTCADRTACRRPGRSCVMVALPAATVITSTSGGGIPAPGGAPGGPFFPSSPQAARSASNNKGACFLMGYSVAGRRSGTLKLPMNSVQRRAGSNR
jgi:hypothetical protein